MRLFCAVRLPASVDDRLATFQREHLTLNGLKPVGGEHFHLTAKFFGDVKDTDVADLTAALEGTADGMTPFTADVKGIGVFPDPRRPRVVWAGVRTGFHELHGLHERIETATAFLGRPPDTHYHPHVTLARVKKSNQNTKVSIHQLLSDSTPSFGAVAVESIQLIQSTLTPQGPRYETLAIHPLSG